MKNLGLVLLLFCSCDSSPEIHDKVDVELTFFPTSGGDHGYTIKISNDTLYVMLRELGIVDNTIGVTEIKKQKSIVLSDVQNDSINSLLKNVNKDFRHNVNSFSLDSWIYVVSIDKQEIARFNSSTLLIKSNAAELESLKKLIKLIMSLSPMKLDLGGYRY